MASELHMSGTPAVVITAINAMAPSNHPGMASLLNRVQSAAIAEVNAYASATRIQIDISCHTDLVGTHISIRAQPSKDP